MSNDKTTLADVQPGGRVRLGDQAERARFEEFLSRNPLMALRAGTAWQVWQAALSAQPSPGGQDALASLQQDYDKLLDSFDRQVEVAEKIAGRVLQQNDRIEELEEALAARQLVGEPAYNSAGISLTACQLHEALLMAGDPELDVPFEDRSLVRIFWTETGHSGPGLYCECVDAEEEGCILLDGTAPAIGQSAQAVDLEQIIEQIAQQWDGCSYDAVGESIDVGQAIRAAASGGSTARRWAMAERPMIAVWFSCGAASAVAAKLTIERYGATHDIRVVNNPVAEEDPDNLRFAADVAVWLGVEIEPAINPKWPTCSCEDVWEKERFMAGVSGAPCTRALKKRARQHWETENTADFHVLGFTVEEQDRHNRFVLTERPNVLPVLIDAGLTKDDCARRILAEGIALPAIYLRGYPNANCIGCVKSQSPTYWNHVREKDPEVFLRRAEQSRRIGAKLVKVRGERIFLDQLKVTDKGGPMKSINFDCGIFCEEPAHG